MSCEDCDEEQLKLVHLERDQVAAKLCYIRVGAADVLVVGCDKHLRQLITERRSNL